MSSGYHIGQWRSRPFLSLQKVLLGSAVQQLSAKTSCTHYKIWLDSYMWNQIALISGFHQRHFLLWAIMWDVGENVFCTHTCPAWNCRAVNIHGAMLDQQEIAVKGEVLIPSIPSVFSNIPITCSKVSPKIWGSRQHLSMGYLIRKHIDVLTYPPARSQFPLTNCCNPGITFPNAHRLLS